MFQDTKKYAAHLSEIKKKTGRIFHLLNLKKNILLKNFNKIYFLELFFQKSFREFKKCASKFANPSIHPFHQSVSGTDAKKSMNN